MNQYFFSITNEERENIKNLHKETYDGYVTQTKGNMYPLTVADMAKDKNGITVNNQGDVTEYKNVNINEMRHDGKDTGLFSDEVKEYHSAGVPPLDGIGDGPLDLKHGTMGDFEDETCSICGMVDCQCDHDDDEFADSHLKFHDDSIDDFYLELDKDDFEDDDIEDDEILSIERSVNESLDMIRRILK
jgi:hypothetical protein